MILALVEARRRTLEMRDLLTSWLLDEALPLWWQLGTDHARGGFYEKIGRDGQPIDEPRRTRVVGRQIFSFATGRLLGWSDLGERAVRHGVDYLLSRCLKSDGTVRSVSSPTGDISAEGFDLYDQAFALFGLASAAEIVPESGLERVADRLLTAIREGWQHSQAGFEEARPRILPLCANPHMHLLEAALAWATLQPQGRWDELADEIAELCLARFIDSESGCLREFYDGDWQPMPTDQGRIVEPGHQFEWAWLLIRWGLLRGRNDALAAARKLVAIAETYGIDAQRGVAIMEIHDDCSVRDRRARVWPQTERLKAWLALSSIASGEAEQADALTCACVAAVSLMRYFATDVPGSWNEWMDEDGRFPAAPSPASTLYHISCAIGEMHRTTRNWLT